MYSYPITCYPVMNNCIIWGNICGDGTQVRGGSTTIQYSCIQGGWSGAGGNNITSDPLFADPDGPDGIAGTSDDNLRLLPGSPCIDAGANHLVPADIVDLDGDGNTSEPIPFDRDGDPRFRDDPTAPDRGAGTAPIVDMGAYESPKHSVLVSSKTVIVPEEGSASFTVSMAADPGELIHVHVDTIGDPDISITSDPVLVFDSSNYSIPQEVSLAAAKDMDTLDGKTVVRLMIGGIIVGGTLAIEQDNDTRILFVKASAQGFNDGSSRENAFTSLQDALAAATELGAEIWVAAGIYKPDVGQQQTPGDRQESFTLRNGVALYGGFAGYESELNQRDPSQHQTILSGDLAGNDGDNFVNYEDNSYSVVYSTQNDHTAIIDGFVITAGNANGPSFGYQYGGGIYIFEKSNPLIRDCFLLHNMAYYGGGIYCGYDCSPTFYNCQITSNISSNIGGGAYLSSLGVPRFYNCLFAMNESGSTGGALTTFCISPEFVNCTVVNNQAVTCGGIYSGYNSHVKISNSILWSNSGEQISGTATVRYSCIQGGRRGVGNISSDPLFVDDDSDWVLRTNSPCIDAGDNAAVPEGIMTDLAGNPRFIDEPNTPNTGIGLPPIVDMGAYEYDPSNYPPRNSFVNIHAVGANDGTSWADAYNHLQDAFAEAASSPVEIYAIWVAAGTYRPDEGADQIPGNRQASFTLLDGVAVYGGFAGNETALDQRDPAANVTILSGDIGVPGDNSDNSLHVVIGSGTDATAVLAGFTITAGNANGSVAPHNSGGGLYISSGSPTINNCVFIANATIGNGAGLYLYSSSPKIANTSFLNNTSLYYGGAIYNRYYSSLTLINCLLAGNTAKLGAAVSSSAGSSATLLNCTISQNTATTTQSGLRPQPNSF
ncbi:MAG: hypothetical protein GXY44_15315 [Phycisphaerales bacterium]|nr:hypothetical protein [Phycisphaerales bacterium]